MCDYCKLNKILEVSTDDNEDIIEVCIKSEHLILEPILSGVWYDTSTTSLKIKINYCPFCGKIINK